MKDNDSEDKEKKNVFSFLYDLQREKHFIRSEKQYIQTLNKTIKNKTEDLLQATWRTTKQRLFLLSQREFTSQTYKQITAIQGAVFVEAKTTLGFQPTIKIENLLRVLRTQPEQLAKWLTQGEQLSEDACQHSEILKSLVTGLYSSCLFPEDTTYMLKLLYELAQLQLVKSEHPRRMLKQGTCSFRILYFVFNEVLPSAKFFLSAALEIPILRVLSHRDLYLDMDRDKSDMRFEQDKDSLGLEFETAANYRNEVVMNLAQFTNNFMASLRENVYSFPKPIAWIVYQISKIITKHFGTKEANAIITELVFTLYICPAIVDPEQYSICDSQITDSARHNLMQVGQIIQILALNKVESPDSKILDIYNLLDKDVVSNFMVDVLFNLEHDDSPPVDVTPTVPRDCALFSEEELYNLLAFLQKVHNESPPNDNLKKRNFLVNSLEEQMASLTLPSSLENSPKTSKPYTNGYSDVTTKKSNFLSLVTKTAAPKQNFEENSRINVLIFQMDNEYNDPVGFISEDKILNMNLLIKKDVVFADPPSDEPAMSVTINRGGDLAPNYPDEGSIGNTSDNLEAISEAASNHSVASSLELENEDQNDNLSDMISANVSGRGTPNISGRDTPSSQVNENEERPLPEARQPDSSQPVQPQLSRQIRSEIDDKFCKFEIKKLLEGDETISIISETWSTDVLASDNETIDAGDGRIDRPTLPLSVDQLNEVPTGNILDISETQSESAWSTDVMTSDTERLTEVDNDDAGSIAQSETRSDDTRSETDENNVVARRLSNSSTGYYVNHSNYVNYQEYRKVEVKNDVKTDANANNVVFKSAIMTDQRIGDNPLNFAEVKTSSTYSSNRRLVSTPLNGTNRPISSKDGAGPSSSTANFSEDIRAEILLSNCSLNSSSSGSSSNSFENNKTASSSRRDDRGEHWGSKQWLNSSGSSLNVTSTPSESTSELSVLSVSNLNNPAILKGKNKSATISTRTLKPSASTGAIPKSISFDMSADKGDKFYDDDHRSKRGGFFGKIKMGFRNRRGKSFRNQNDFRLESEEYNAVSKNNPRVINAEVSDDILAKYRTKPLVDNSPVKDTSEADGNKSSLNKERNSDDSNNCNAADINNSFDDIKKKLRSVLSNTSQIPKVVKENRLPLKSKIETILRLNLGKARKLKEWSNIGRISEAIRCINLLNESSCLTLVESMKEDITQRAVYTQYLICSRKELLQCESYLDGLIAQIRNEKHQCEEYLSVICVRRFLIEQEGLVVEFCKEFKEINPSDEKCDSLNNFYEQLFSRMEENPLWKDIFRTRTDVIKITLERFIMSKVYLNALYPNGDGDRHRDNVLRQHIETLSTIISPEHKYLMINKMFLREFPWIPAQDALKAMDAYKTPRDKVNCVVHCAKCIMDLLSFSRSTGSTTADDFTPVLVYVIITVNPRDLLSTIQFVDSFYSSQLCGEDHYWWTQFSSAVEYIKTMDYSD